uniref:Uncharacterized protein n=1 Tax=viral metagenome TaxID=1070528 RepID=A0A6M3Y1A7_9ZZZZ
MRHTQPLKGGKGIYYDHLANNPVEELNASSKIHDLRLKDLPLETLVKLKLNI